ncbi:MAG: hypothetical protein HY873_06270 [Chloroflexi bacterium]|nr:hypothetical protein [Chloroflexota bacterium]
MTPDDVEAAGSDVALPGDAQALTLAATAGVVYGGLAQQVVDAAGKLDSVDPEVTLLRVWLTQTVNDEKKDHALMLKLLGQIVEAVAVRYRLSPKRTKDLSSALVSVLEQMNEQMGARVEDEV